MSLFCDSSVFVLEKILIMIHSAVLWKVFRIGWKSNFNLWATALRFVELNKSADSDSVLLHYLKRFQPTLIIGHIQVFYYKVPAMEEYGSLRLSEVLSSSHTRQAPVCRCSVLWLTVRTVLFQSRNPPFIHFPLQKKNLSKGRIGKFLQGQWRHTWRTLEILSLLHWLTPLLTLTMHSTARFRECCTSSRGGTTEILGMERVTLALKMACWLLPLPRLGASPSAEW